MPTWLERDSTTLASGSPQRRWMGSPERRRRGRLFSLPLVLWSVSTVVLGGMAAIYLVWLIFRSGEGTGVLESGGSRYEKLFRSAKRKALSRVFDRDLEYEKIEHAGGLRFRIEDLGIPYGKGGGKFINLPSAEFEVEPDSLSVSAYLDALPFVEALVAPRLPFLVVPPGGKLPIQVRVPKLGFKSLELWTFEMDASGRSADLDMLDGVVPVPLRVDRGRVTVRQGTLQISNLVGRMAEGSFRLDLEVPDINGLPRFESGRLQADLDLETLLKPEKEHFRPPSGNVKLDLDISGTPMLPRLKGDVSGSFSLEAFPIEAEKAGALARRVTLRMKDMEGKVEEGGDGVGVLSTAKIETKRSEFLFASLGRRIGFRSDSAVFRTRMKGTIRNLVFDRFLDLTRGEIVYSTGHEGADPRGETARAGTTLEFERLNVEYSTSGDRIELSGTAKKFIGADGEGWFRLDTTKTPHDGSYELRLKGVDIAEFGRFLFGSAVQMGGKLDFVGKGTADAMQFPSMQGIGAGKLKGFTLRWIPPSTSLTGIDIAEAMQGIYLDEVDVELPVFGNGVLIRLRGRSNGIDFRGLFGVDTDLEATGRFEFQFDPSILAARPAVKLAMVRLGFAEGVVLELKGPLGQVRHALVAR